MIERLKSLFAQHKTEMLICLGAGFVVGTFFGGILGG